MFFFTETRQDWPKPAALVGRYLGRLDREPLMAHVIFEQVMQPMLI